MKAMPHQCKVFAIFSVFLMVILHLLQTGSSAVAAQSVGSVMAVEGNQVATTAVSPSPRPIRLEKIMQTVDLEQSNPVANMSQAVASGSFQEAIETCELVAVQGNEMTLRFQYRINPNRSRPIYAGAWLYDSSRQVIDAGYKPIAVSAVPGGSLDVVLVLPDHNFHSDYVVAFLMESSQPVFVNGRFKMDSRWQEGVLSGPGLPAQIGFAGAADAASPQTNTAFCKEYAQTALAQYTFATTNNLPGIVPPVWSNDYAVHYNWCLGVPRENAKQGTALRLRHLERYKKADVGYSQGQPGSPVKASAMTMPTVGKAMVVKPSANKKLDPGLGP